MMLKKCFKLEWVLVEKKKYLTVPACPKEKNKNLNSPVE